VKVSYFGFGPLPHHRIVPKTSSLPDPNSLSVLEPPLGRPIQKLSSLPNVAPIPVPMAIKPPQAKTLLRGDLKTRRSKTSTDVLRLIQALGGAGAVSYEQLVRVAASNQIGQKKLARFVRELKTARKIEAVKVERPGTKSAISYRLAKAKRKNKTGPKQEVPRLGRKAISVEVYRTGARTTEA